MNPLFFSCLIIVIFIASSEFIFSKFPTTPSIYVILALGLIYSSANGKRIEFLKQCFTQKEFRQIVLLENLFLGLPFTLYLLFKGHYNFAFGMFICGTLLSFLPAKVNLEIAFPTPFSKFPFEFTRGFRLFLPLIFVTYIFLFISISVNNFNMGVLVILVSILITANFFTYQENNFFVWIHHHSPKAFLWQKIITIFRYGFLLSLPISLILLSHYPFQYMWILLSNVVGILYILLFLVMKYAFLPSKPTFADELIQSFSILFPPVLLLTIPYYTVRSMKNLKFLLHD